MDIFAMTRKRRPSRLTMAPSSQPAPEPDMPRSLSLVTGPPSNYHWKLDKDATTCAHPSCAKQFGLLERRHHCRKCGDVFCTAHCSNYMRLDQNCSPHPDGTLARACDLCVADWRHPSLTMIASVSSSDSPIEKENVKPKNRHATIMTLQPHALEGVLELGRDDIVQQDHGSGVAIASKNNKADVYDAIASTVPNVPSDWQWSTF
ncbi:hypothetical protein BC940DRAFT_298616 [Gongronella butleri]|nr:hypothetical protein BC940DRAFT_298616 [Gongronella butleri]